MLIGLCVSKGKFSGMVVLGVCLSENGRGGVSIFRGLYRSW